MSERELGRGEKGRARPTFIGREWCRGEREKTAGHGAIDSHQWEVAIMERKWGGEREGETAARLASSNQREAERLGVANRRGGPAGARAGSAARGGRGETRGWAPRVSERGRE
jgi:hypothetical protein